MSNVIKEYQAKKTSFSQSLVPISELPTVVICLGDYDPPMLEYGKELVFWLFHDDDPKGT